MIDRDKQIEEAAVFYWQDRLAKFSPTSKGPCGTEKDMFRAGVKWAEKEKRSPEAILLRTFVVLVSILPAATALLMGVTGSISFSLVGPQFLAAAGIWVWFIVDTFRK